MPVGPLVSVAWLQRHLGEEDLAVADCRFRLMEPEAGAALYAAGHVPGAVFLDVGRDLAGPRAPAGARGPLGGRHPLPAPERLAQRLGMLGIGDGCRVVAYDDDSSFAPRLWWLLRYLGHREAALLDGGLPAWQAAGGALTREVPLARPRAFTPRPDATMVADRRGVAERDPGTVLLDARSPERFRGEVEPIDPVAGHIPGAVNAPHFEGQEPDGRWLPPEAQRRRFAPLVPVGAPAIAYCGSGMTACANLLAMELAGITGARLYPGSFSDWCAHPESPVAQG